jgi:hypothetical protein
MLHLPSDVTNMFSDMLVNDHHIRDVKIQVEYYFGDYNYPRD